MVSASSDEQEVLQAVLLAVRAVGDDADVDPGHGVDQALQQRLAQPAQAAARLGPAEQHVGGAALLRDALDHVGDVIAVLDEQVDAQHGGQPAQRVELRALLGGRLLAGAGDPQQVELAAEALGGAPRAADDRAGCGAAG